MTPHLSVVIPAHNEGHRLGGTLQAAMAYLRRQAWAAEILVVDDGSRDATAAIAAGFDSERLPVRVLRFARNRGKGAAVRAGCLAARGDYVLFMDADHSTHIDEVEAFLACLQEGYDLASGVRTFQEGESRMRRILGLGFLMLAHLIVFRRAVVDSQCGFKCFTRRSAQRIFSLTRTEGGTIDVEIFYLAQRLGLRPCFLPVHWRNAPGSTISPWRCVVQDPIDMLRIRLRRYPEEDNAESR